MYLQASRLPARQDADGNLLLLAEQDRTLWDRQLIAAGLQHLGDSATGEELTAYHLQAGIAAYHALAPSYEQTNWEQVLAQYDHLIALAPSPIALLNRAIAVSMVEGPGTGLRALDAIQDDPALRGYYLLPATRADLLLRLGRREEAASCYQEALARLCTDPERRFLIRRLASCG
jgi:RNA polymerase sigma-70 factor (ECF subfamily)